MSQQGETTSQRVRVQNFTVSSDGYATGEGQSLERPFGHANPAELMEWAAETASQPGRDDSGGSRGIDDYFVRDFHHRIGAEIMGRNKFGPQRGPWDDHDWTGWWGDDPPFHCPVFVLTHHERPTFTLSDTTFNFLAAAPLEALERAKGAANGLDVRIGGGPTTVRSFVEAGIVDDMHIVVAPIKLGAGERFWDDPTEFDDRFHHETCPSPNGVTHHVLWRKAAEPNPN